jgi:hypothetical protein
MYDFLTQLHDEFESLHAQLLAHNPHVSLMDALRMFVEETRLCGAGLVPSSSVSATRSAFSQPTAFTFFGVSSMCPTRPNLSHMAVKKLYQ